MKWFSFAGIKTEIQRIRWPHPEELMKSTWTVVLFTCAFALFFVLCESFSAVFLKLIGA
ncbi:MAG: preprotein translocase subunit SecE [Erysipelotrichaceae bacterium]